MTATRPSDTCVQTMEDRQTGFGLATYIRIHTHDYRRLAWSEIWATFADSFPGQWAIQCFPPASDLVDHENIYHLFVLESPPSGLNIKRH